MYMIVTMKTRAHTSGETHTTIRQWRTAKQKTLLELQEQTGIDHSMLSKLELGQRRLNIDHIVSISEALGLEPFQLFITPEDTVMAIAIKLRNLSEDQLKQALAVLNALQISKI